MNRYARELLLDSEVVLRMVDEAVEDELDGLGDAGEACLPRLRLLQAKPRVPDAAAALERASADAADAVRVLRRARGTLDLATALVPWTVAGRLNVTGGLLEELESKLERLADLLETTAPPAHASCWMATGTAGARPRAADPSPRFPSPTIRLP